MNFEQTFSSHPSDNELALFRNQILDYYRREGRAFPWREEISPYRVYVSEIMLQQTQTHRVEGRFIAWMQEVPDFQTLAELSTEKLLSLWQGLGYNRRALALREGAKRVTGEFAGHLPEDPALLQSLPGIGPATAASISAFAFNRPVVFIETNIRRVFLHFFFADTEQVADSALLPLVEASLYRPSPRDWYNALMDIGTILKKRVTNPNRRSRHYVRQAPFEGSNRQARGAILKVLQSDSPQGTEELSRITGIACTRIDAAARQLVDEGFLAAENGKYGSAGVENDWRTCRIIGHDRAYP